MTRPENLDRDARLMPEVPPMPSSYETLLYERGENARWAKEMEARHKVDEIALQKCSDVCMEQEIEISELKARIEKVAVALDEIVESGDTRREILSNINTQRLILLGEGA